jgi:hypothetical protein
MQIFIRNFTWLLSSYFQAGTKHSECKDSGFGLCVEDTAEWIRMSTWCPSYSNNCLFLVYFETKFYPALILPMGAVDPDHNILLNFSSHMITVFDWFIHSIGMCRKRRFLAVLRSFFSSSLLYTGCRLWGDSRPTTCNEPKTTVHATHTKNC